MANEILFDTFPTVLGNAKITPSQFAILVLEMIRTEGLAELLDKFRDHGFDDAARTWVGSGKNLSLSAQDVERVLGPASIQALAREANIAPKAAATEVASLLPQLVDKLTPAGHLPDKPTLDKYFDLLRQKIGML